MGKISNSINHYLRDNRRFADLFNGICFQGKTVIHAEDLSEISQVYHEIAGEDGNSPGRRERTRDICKILRTGKTSANCGGKICGIKKATALYQCIPYVCIMA